jgi:hypothetical protein
VKKPFNEFDIYVDFILLSGIWLFISLFLDVRLLLMDTIVTGGDTASWYQIAKHLQQTLVPNGRLTGWDMGNFCGYPNFNFYFLPPFLIAVLLSYIGIPLTIALKLVIVSGWYILPISVYYGLRLMNYRFPAPVIGAFSSLLLLFNESYTMFGGNVLSTLAGEFCYMFAFSLLPYYIGSMTKGFLDENRIIRNGCILGLIGLSHLFVFIPALSIVLYGFFRKKKIAYIIQVCLLGFGIMAFWILPLIAWRKLYTIPVYMIWQSFISWPISLLAVSVFFVIFFPIIVLQKKYHYPPKKHIIRIVILIIVNRFLPICCIILIILFLGYGLLSSISSELPLIFPGTKIGLVVLFVWSIWMGVIVLGTQMGQTACHQWVKFQPDWHALSWMICSCIVMYFCAHFLKIPDIRFVPPVLLALVMIIFANYIGHYLCVLPSPVKYTGLLFCTISIFIVIICGAKNAPKWYAYNFKGYEQTRGYKDLKAISKYLKNTNETNALNAPRVGYEKCDRYGPYGGDRVFESLFMLSGRQTLEGIHYSSSIASKFITFLQTEFSKDIKTPTPYILSQINPIAAANHMFMYNISQLILMTQAAKKVFQNSFLFTHEKDIEAFSIYRLNQESPGYVSPLTYLPVLYTGKNWLEQFYQNWFKYPEKSNIYFVPDQYVKHPEDRNVFQDRSENLDIQPSWFHQQIGIQSDIKIDSNLEHLQITFTTNAIGVPHLIRVSYFPNWDVQGAHGIYPVTPHFMLVIPRSSTVTLTYSHCMWEIFGGWMTFFTLMCLLLVLISQQSKKLKNAIKPFENLWHSIVNHLYFLENKVKKVQTVLLVGMIFVAIFLSISGAIYRNQPVRTFIQCNELYENGIKLKKQMDLKQADLTFKKAINILTHLNDNRFQYDHQDMINCLLLTAHCYEQLNQFKQAQAIYNIILNDFPYCRYIAESCVKKARLFRKYRYYNIQAGSTAIENGDYHSGLKYLTRSLEQTQQSIKQLEKAISIGAQTQWTKTAQKELTAEMNVLEKIHLRMKCLH